MPENLRGLERQIGYYFHDQKILSEAMTHGSSRVQNVNLPHHERLEFLGDSILSAVFSEYLFQKEATGTPGQLTERRKMYISDARQNEIAQKIGIAKYVNMSNVKQFARYGEFVEALIGAIYIDAGGSNGNGLAEVKKVIFKLWEVQPPSASQTGCVIV